MRLIDQEYTARPFLGSRKLTKWLVEQGQPVNRKRVQRLMRRMGLEAIYPKPKLSAAGRGHRVYPYLLRGVAIERPDQVWSTDITYVLLARGFMYLATIIDWYNRYVISWRLSNTLDGSFCLEMLEEALGQGRPEVFNTDQGVQFPAAAWTGRLEAAGVAVSMDGKGRCLDNVFVERLWRSVKEDRWLPAVAREMNLSETTFLVKQPDHFDLRWFAPKVEVDLCGHSTLASAHVLWQQGKTTSNEIRFSTRSGILTALNKQGEIELDFPLEPDEPAPPPAHLVAALNISPPYVGKNRFDHIVEVNSGNTLRHLEPDFRLLETVPCRGVIVTSRSADPQFDFVSRAFFPRLGVDEDPVSGSAHCCLVNFWRKRLGKSEFVAFQVSARGGVVKVRVVKDRVFLSGKAATVAKGEVLVEERDES